VLNPLAQLRTPITIQDYLASRWWRTPSACSTAAWCPTGASRSSSPPPTGPPACGSPRPPPRLSPGPSRSLRTPVRRLRPGLRRGRRGPGGAADGRRRARRHRRRRAL
jgi:hypothetical protein